MLFPKRDETTDADPSDTPQRVHVVAHRVLVGVRAYLSICRCIASGHWAQQVHRTRTACFTHLQQAMAMQRSTREKKKKHRLGCQCQAWRGRGLGTERAARSKQNVAASTSPLITNFHQGVHVTPSCVPHVAGRTL